VAYKGFSSPCSSAFDLLDLLLEKAKVRHVAL
jgi:hypothetical protein